VRVLLAWSGGKDSTLALAALREQPDVIVAGLLTSVTADYERISIHGVRRAILEAQADRLGLPLFEARLDAGSSNEDYDLAWWRGIESAREALGPLTHIAYGDLFLEDVRRYREDQAERLACTPVFPLWGLDTQALAETFVDAGYEAWITCVDTTQLDARFAGRRFDRLLLDELPPDVDPCGERGEFHTCVVAGPMFGPGIAVERGEVVRRDERFEYCDLLIEPGGAARNVAGDDRRVSGGP